MANIKNLETNADSGKVTWNCTSWEVFLLLATRLDTIVWAYLYLIFECMMKL